MSDDLYAGDESSGLLTHFVGRVKQGLWSTFFAETQGKASGDNAQQTLWFGHVDVVDILQANYESKGAPVETILVSLGIGNGWHQDPNDPNLVEHEDDTPDFKKKFHANSLYMKVAYLIAGKASEYENAVVLDGDDEHYEVDLTGVRKVHADKGLKTLRDATLYDGCVFEYRGLGIKYRPTDQPRPKPLPIRFLGYDVSELPDISKLSGVSGNSTTNSGGAARPTLGTVPPAVLDTWTSASASDPTIATLTRLWESSPNVEAFIGNAGMLPDVKTNEELAKAIVDTPDPATAPETAPVAE